MKEIDLGNGRVAMCSVTYGNEKPKLSRPSIKPGDKLYQSDFKSVEIKVTVFEGKDQTQVAEFKGMSYCSPTDRWNRVKGRSYALVDVFNLDRTLAIANAKEAGVQAYGRKQLEPYRVLDMKARKLLAERVLPWVFPENKEKAEIENALSKLTIKMSSEDAIKIRSIVDAAN